MLLIILLALNAFAYLHKQEQHWMDLYNKMNSIKEFLSQLEYYTALEKLEFKSQENLEFEEESLTIYKEHYQEIINSFKQQLTFNKNEKEDIKLFLRETFPEVVERIKRIIVDKEKLIEGDIKELAKLKHQQPEDISQRFEEFNHLHKKIQEVLEQNDEQIIYKTVELLESKIMIGSFKQIQSQEVDFFMKSVDKLFREKQNPHKKQDAIQLLSLMSSVISEYLIKIVNDQIESSFEFLDKELFFTESKKTHFNAKEQYINLLNRLDCNVYLILRISLNSLEITDGITI
ncbi:unnamed protein product (macronuclear) [Paramecium tetraurelia]|uniref:Uncharacterized protein n=1 Tax=Paramecium tetraurelia TaxID=5888 RepID=A0BJN3_PARTE|nr:uncharacterized protein GSPATT00029378001 [Paramecium tetraurelia]CAK58750.1 unnamed protein product [Paramecium tetraurelia]|eukprot:XP_001426148.1 hypothetical protein (macronuclear) [Paramecium tetraurelia strain d4-2]